MNDEIVFRITGGKGFQMRLPNGYTVSIQFGAGDDCSHRRESREDSQLLAAQGSRTADVAIIGLDGKFVSLPAHITGVNNPRLSLSHGYATAQEVLNVIEWAGLLPAEQEAA